jgi:hypothetical protein
MSLKSAPGQKHFVSKAAELRRCADISPPPNFHHYGFKFTATTRSGRVIATGQETHKSCGTLWTQIQQKEQDRVA